MWPITTSASFRDALPRVGDEISLVWRARPRGITLALRTTAVLLPLVAVSGAECVDALVSAGFAVRSRSGDTTLLVKGGRSVVVRGADLLMPDELLSILREAGLAYSDFVDLLSEAPTDPDLRRSMWLASALRQ